MNNHNLSQALKSNIKNKKFTLNDDQLNLLREAFDLFDMEKTGKIDYHELKLTLKAFGFNVKKQEILGIMKKFGENRENIENDYGNPNHMISQTHQKITFDEFMDIMTEKFSERDPREEAIMAFDLFDEDRKGKINIKNLKKAVKELNENLTEYELKAIIEEFDTDNDGYITKEDFMKIMDEYYFD
jgi:centrin-3